MTSGRDERIVAKFGRGETVGEMVILTGTAGQALPP
jgi:hypothetical protein